MGLRQPSATGAYFAQAGAGSAKQKEARDKLKKPQAIGGSAGVGTQMVAATTGAQQQATQQVKDTAQQAGKDLNVNQGAVGTATVNAIRGTGSTATVNQGSNTSDQIAFTPVSGPSIISPEIKTTQDAIAKLTTDLQTADKALRTMTNPADYKNLYANKKRIESELQSYQATLDRLNLQSGLPSVEGIGARGDATAVANIASKITENIEAVTAQLDALNSGLETADASDRKALQDEKTRLEGLLKTYQEKMSKENLGQIAGPSDFEQQMLEREQFLAEEGGDVGKVAALFGRKAGDIRTGKYGALESQIYGKDLEAIREAARAGLAEKGVAERATDTALEGYTGQLETSKKGYEKRLANETKKLDLLKSTPQELAGYSRKELTDLFGKDVVDRLFTFSGTDDAAKVTNTKVSETRKALEERQTKLTDELAKVPGETEKAQTLVDTNYNTAESSVFGKGDEPGAFGKISSVENEIKEAMGKFDELNSRSAFTRKEGHSKEVNYWQTVIAELQDGYRKLSKLKNEAQSIKDDKSLSKSQKTIKLKKIKSDIDRVAQETKENRSRHRI